MTINRKLQCRTSYQDYLLFHSRQLLAQMTPESKQRLAEQLQVRINLMGEKPVNGEIYQQVLNKLKEDNGNGNK